MSSYTKLFSSILDSTVWDHSPHVRIVWITMLAMADRYGVVEASVPGLAKRAGVERSHVELALALFRAPDPDSRSKEHEGRRIKEVDGGWRLLNHDKYRLKASAADNAERQSRWRAKHAEGDPEGVAEQPPSNAPVTGVTRNNARYASRAEAEAPLRQRQTLPEKREREEQEAPAAPSLGAVVPEMRSALKTVGIPPSDLTSGRWTTIAQWVIDYVGANPRRDVKGVCASLARGFKANSKAAGKGWPLPYLAKNPMEYLDKESTARSIYPEDYEGGSGSTAKGTLADPIEALLAEADARRGISS